MYELNLGYEGKRLPIASLTSVVSNIKGIGLKEAKEFVDNNSKKVTGDNGIETTTLKLTIFDDQREKATKFLREAFGENPNIHWTIEEITESQSPAQQQEGLGDVIEFAKQMEETGVYVVPTEAGLQLVVITHLPANQELVSRIMAALQDACCNVSEKNITTEKGNPGIRLQITKMFPQGAKELNDVVNVATSIHDIIIDMMMVIDIEKAAKSISDKLSEAVKQLSW